MSRIMAHLVAHYPDSDRSLAVAEGLIEGGAAYLEVQFPFSDPTADGPVIQEACQYALDGGFSVDAGFDLVRAIRSVALASGRDVPVFIMSYASLLVARGVARFLEEGAHAGAAGFILPDIPLDYDEGVWQAAADIGTTIMPVSVTSAREARVALLIRSRPEYIYVALRRGITGARTVLDDDNLRFLARLRDTGAKIMAGFGITERSQVLALEPYVHACVVGSAFVRTVTAHGGEPPERLRSLLADQIRGFAGPEQDQVG